MTVKYDKSKVMKRAWYIYRHSFMSFGDALRESWKRVKEETLAEAKIKEQSSKFQAKHKSYNYRLNRTYNGRRFGHDDWVSDYQDDIYVAVNRSQDLRKMK